MMHADSSVPPAGSPPSDKLAEGRLVSRYADPLESDDDENNTNDSSQARQPQANTRVVESPEHLTSVKVVTEPREDMLTTFSAYESKQSSSCAFSSAACRGENGTSAAAPNAVKNTITVEVTTDGRTHNEEFDPRELARLFAQQQAALRSVRGEFDILYVPDWVRLHPLLGSYLAEAFGTFACVLTLALVSVRNQSIFNKVDDVNMMSLPIGFMFMSMVFTFGYVSGGHFNPAVTISVFLVRKLDFVRTVGYIACQTGASVGAGLVAMSIQGSTNIFVPHVSKEYVSSGIFSELIFTFALATVVLNVAYSRQSGNFFYGFAIGMTIAAGTAAVGKISGGAFNPAAATGLQLALCLTGDCDPLSSFWVYWMAPLVGAVMSSILYTQMYQPENTNVLSDAAALHADSTANGVQEDQ